VIVPAQNLVDRSLRRVRQLVFLAMLSLFCAASLQMTPRTCAAATAQAQTPEQVIRQTVDQVFGILRDPALAKDSARRMAALREVVDRVFDWKEMARSSLGHPWRGLSQQQRADFVTVFKELLAREYMGDIDRFQGTERVSVDGAEKTGDLVVVKTVLSTASHEHVPMNYTLQASDERWWVGDLSIEGVSLVAHYRETFSRFLANKSFDELMTELRRKLAGAR
jgi:phospholipid transport system substrate-binding protein